MLSQTQKNAVFTNIGTAYTVGGVGYTATKTYTKHWSGEIDTPIILLNYPSDAELKQDTIGKDSEWDTAQIEVSIFAQTDIANSLHGSRIAEEIARTLLLWFKQTADTALNANGISIEKTYPVVDKSAQPEKVYIMGFKADLAYELF